MANIYPLQYFGIGDVIYTMQLVKTLALQHEIETGEDSKIVWGVMPQFVEGLQRAYPDVSFVDYRLINIDYNCRTEKEVMLPAPGKLLPIRWADSILGVSYDKCMRAKYDMYGKNYRSWIAGAGFTRDKKQENDLLEMILESTNNKPFILVNEYYQSDGNGVRKIYVEPENGEEIVYMNEWGAFSLFDWAGVIEAAEEVHTVSTSLFYLLELLNLKSPAHLYSRPTDPHFKHIDYLFSKPYILHT